MKRVVARRAMYARFQSAIVPASAPKMVLSIVLLCTCAAPRAEQSTPTYRPDCFASAPNASSIAYKQSAPPYKLAFVNGFAENDWRIQAIQSAKAWARRASNADKIERFSVVSVGNSTEKLIAAINRFIEEDYDAIVFIATDPDAFADVVRNANKHGTVLVAFDNLINSDSIVQINQDQSALGALKADFVVRYLNGNLNKILMVNGLPGNATNRDRRAGMMSILDKVDGLQVIEVTGDWDTATTKTAVKTALLTHPKFDALISQHGTSGAIEALQEAKHPIIPIGADGENGVRTLMHTLGIPGISASQSPAMSAVALEASIALLSGNALPNKVLLPIPWVTTDQMIEGVDFFKELPKTFNTGTGYRECFEPFEPEELLGQGNLSLKEIQIRARSGRSVPASHFGLSP